MNNSLPIFIKRELFHIASTKSGEVERTIRQIIRDSQSQKEKRFKLFSYLNSLPPEEISEDDELIFLAFALLSYWSEEYKEIITIYSKFEDKIDKANLSLLFAIMLSYRELYLLTEFQRITHKIADVLDKRRASKEKEFLLLALDEFKSSVDNRPEVKFKAINEIIRFLTDKIKFNTHYSFILETLQHDLIQEAYFLTDEKLKNVWIESMLEIAKNTENDGMLFQLYAFLARLAAEENNLVSSKEYLDEALQLSQKIESDKQTILYKFTTAKIQRIEGDVKGTLENLNSILSYDHLTNPLRLKILAELGYIYLHENDIEKASRYFAEAHEINSQSGYLNSMIEILHGYLNLIQKVDQGQSFEKGRELAENKFDFHSLPYYYFYKGLYNQKMVNLLEAVNNFIRALDMFEDQLIFEGIVYTYGALAESFFQMYKVTEKEEHASNFLYYIDNLLKITEELKHPLYVDASIAKSNLYRYMNTPERVLEILYKGLEFAENNDFPHKVDEINIIIDNYREPAKIAKGYEDFFKKIRLFAFGSHKKIPTDIHLVLLISDSGIPLYSLKLAQKEFIDDLLISGLISAIISFSSEVLGKGSETLRSINHEGKTVMIEQINRITALLVVENETFEIRLLLRKLLKEAMGIIEERKTDQPLKPNQIIPIVTNVFSEFNLDIKPIE